MSISRPSAHTPSGILFWLALPVCCWLFFVSVSVNLSHGCHWKQWPALPSCQNPGDLPIEQQIQNQRAYLAVNPGDSLAFADLARFAGQPETLLNTTGTAVLNAASLTAPFDATVLRLKAGQSIQEEDWPTAVSQLILLAEKYGNSDARTALAMLIVRSRSDPGLLEALLLAARKDQAWLESVVQTLPAAKVPASAATLLVGRLAQADGLTPKLGQQLIKQLKAEGAWVDAHAIWLNLWKKPLAFLFNGDFEQPFISGAFDWEVTDNKPYQAGAQANLSNSGKSGQALQIKFTGRLIKTPIVSQDLILPPGSYQLTGEYQSNNLRSDQGLAWVLTCANGKQELTRSTALTRTGQNWTPFTIRFRVSGACGPLIHLSLQTQAPYEAKTGQHGEMQFDHFNLTREAAQ